MPSITRNEAREQELLARLRSRPRLEGQHVTDTIYCSTKAWGMARLGMIGETVGFNDATLLRFLMGHGMASILEEGQVSQIQAIAPDTQDVGTLDIWFRDHPIEIKVTHASTRRDIGEMDHWLQQLGEYVWRSTDRKRRSPWGELWAIHLLGDHGKKFCAEHGVPEYPNGETPFRRKHPDTDRPRLACPVDGCWVFLEEGRRETMLRCHAIHWTWEELNSLHLIHAWRQGRLQETIADPQWQPGNPPPIEWGFDFECPSCPVKERIGCPGRGERLLEWELEESLLVLGGKSIEQVTREEIAR